MTLPSFMDEFISKVGIHKHCRKGDWLSFRGESIQCQINLIELYAMIPREYLEPVIPFLKWKHDPKRWKEVKRVAPQLNQLDSYHKKYHLLTHGALPFNRATHVFHAYGYCSEPNRPCRIEFTRIWDDNRTHLQVLSDMLRVMSSFVFCFGVRTEDPFAFDDTGTCITLEQFYKIYSQENVKSGSPNSQG